MNVISMDFDQARFNMVEQQIRTWEVLDQTVLDTLFAVPRERFVPSAYRLLAFSDTRIPLGCDQYMLPPRVEARIVQALAPRPTDRALLVGSGSGYVTALLARLAREVTSVELHAEIASMAAQNLRAAVVTNAEVVNADAVDGFAEHAPYDLIAVTASCASRRPVIEQQLAIGGRMFVVVGAGHPMDALLVTRRAPDVFATESLFEFALEPLVGAEPRPQFAF